MDDNAITFEQFEAVIEGMLYKLQQHRDVLTMWVVADLGAGENWTVQASTGGGWYLRYWVGSALVHDKLYSKIDELVPIMFGLYPHDWRVAKRVYLAH